MNDKVDLNRRIPRPDLAPQEVDQDRWSYHRKPLAEKMHEAIEKARVEFRRAVRKALESES